MIAMVLRVPELLDAARDLDQEEFSSAFLGKVYGQLRLRHEQGLDVSLGVLADLSSDEMSHVTAVYQRQQGPVHEQALADCIQIIKSEHSSANVTSEDDLMAFRNKLRESKGVR